MRGLYAIVDPAECGGRDPLTIADAILAGGCAMLQLRSKQLADAPLLALARSLRERCSAHDVPFVVNDRVDIALLCPADGVHLGQQDLSLADVRLLAPKLACGVSTHSSVQAEAAQREGATLIGYGPIFATRTKHNPDPVVGVAGLAAVQRAARVPVVAIGGIDLANLPAVLATGVPLVCAIGAVLRAPDPESVARAIHRQTQDAA